MRSSIHTRTFGGNESSPRYFLVVNRKSHEPVETSGGLIPCNQGRELRSRATPGELIILKGIADLIASCGSRAAQSGVRPTIAAIEDRQRQLRLLWCQQCGRCRLWLHPELFIEDVHERRSRRRRLAAALQAASFERQRLWSGVRASPRSAEETSPTRLHAG